MIINRQKVIENTAGGSRWIKGYCVNECAKATADKTSSDDEKKGAYVVAVILVFIFVIRGIILPVINRVGGKNTDKPAQVQAETDTNANINTGDSGTETQIEKDTNAAIRKPLKGASDLTKVLS